MELDDFERVLIPLLEQLVRQGSAVKVATGPCGSRVLYFVMRTHPITRVEQPTAVKHPVSGDPILDPEAERYGGAALAARGHRGE